MSFNCLRREVTYADPETTVERATPYYTMSIAIATPRGEVAIEDLKVGDKVITRDNGIQEICWVGGKKMSWADIGSQPHLKPILITQGSLGRGLPERDMMVSPNHRILVTENNTALRFNETEVLVPAKHLVSARGVSEVSSGGTSYIHFMCARHQVILANGAWTESFQPSDYSLKGLGNAQRNEIFEIFPDLKTEEGKRSYGAARKTVSGTDARVETS
jgi:hypothetical protein